MNDGKGFIGKVVRYGDGCTALFLATQVASHGNGNFWLSGRHVRGGSHGSSLRDCSLANEEDIKVWHEHTRHKPKTTANLTFDEFRAANVARCIKWHPKGIESWSASDWMTAIIGELGEAASLIKMRNRERDGLPGNKFSPLDSQIAAELADVATYLDLLAAMQGIDLGRAIIDKFNEVSERVGFPDRLPLTTSGPTP